MKMRDKKPLRLRDVPRRAKSRGTIQPSRGWQLVNAKQTLYWKVDVARIFGTKEHYVVLRIRPSD